VDEAPTGLFLGGYKLTHLSLTNCSATGEDLWVLVQACPWLVDLNVDWVSEEAMYRRINWYELGYYLRRCPRLENLRLVYNDKDGNEKHREETREAGIIDLNHSFPTGLRLAFNTPGLIRATLAEKVLFSGLEGLLGQDRQEVERWKRPRPLRQVVPHSLEVLTVVVEDKQLNRLCASRYLNDPRAAELQGIVVMNHRGDRRFSKKDGEGGC
jgi:hypothetical protein